MSAKLFCRLNLRIFSQISYKSYPVANVTRNYASAKPAAGKVLVASKSGKTIDVETDPEKLCKFLCGGNIYIEGKEPELKPDSEYPDWLWNLRTERGQVPVEEMDKDSHEYWDYVKMKVLEKERRLKKVKLRFKIF